MLWTAIPLLILLGLSYNSLDDDMRELWLLALYATCLPAVLSLIAFFASREKLTSIKSGSSFKFWSPTTIYSMTLLFCVVGIAFLAYQNFWLKKTVDHLADQAGTAQAVSEFKRGRLILWEIVATNDTPRFSGLYDGPFEIWYGESYDGPAAWLYGQLRLDEAHNKQMRLMQLHPERFKAETQATGDQTRVANDANLPTNVTHNTN